jgi:DMSO reductase family type II enzyme chaperone
MVAKAIAMGGSISPYGKSWNRLRVVQKQNHMSAVTKEASVVSVDWSQTDLYRFFALVFSPPTHQCFDFLSQPAAHPALRELWNNLGCEGSLPPFKWFPTYELYESAYIALFDVGVPEPPVPLFESAHNKSHPAQEIALENTFFYEVLGLRTDSTHAVPDYLVTQLEFLAALRYACENTLDEANAIGLIRAEAEFVQRHLLGWLPIVESKLARIDPPAFPQLMTMLVKFLRNRLKD